MVNRARKRGYTTDVRRARDLPADELEQLKEYATLWRHGGTERGYSMALGRLGEPEDDATIVVRVFDGDGVVAFNTYVPWGEHGASLDFMRRSPTCESGVNELTVTALAEAGPAMGIERVSLNFAAFRSIIDRGERMGASALSRFNRNALVAVSRWVQIDSLYRFNAKFGPRWVPRYIMYPDGRSMPHVGLAFLEAEGFLPALSRRRAMTD
jgi:lysyl-tRNA synthetase class 2